MERDHGVPRRRLLRAGGIVGAAGAGALLADAAPAQAAAPAATGTFNVLDYGATGTGQQDDTAAAQAPRSVPCTATTSRTRWTAPTAPTCGTATASPLW